MTYDFAVASVLSIDRVKLPDQDERVSLGSCGLYISSALRSLNANIIFAAVHGADIPLNLIDDIEQQTFDFALVELQGATAELQLRYNSSGDVDFVKYRQNIGAEFRARHLPAEFNDAQIYWLGTAPFELLKEVAQRAVGQNRPLYLTTQDEFSQRSKDLSQLIPSLAMLCTNTGELTRYGFGDLLSTLRRLYELNPALSILATRGARGAWLLQAPYLYRISAYSAPATLHSIGAGDTFAAAYAWHLQKFGSIEGALQTAVAAATLKLEHFGYQNMPNQADIEAFLAHRGTLPVEHTEWESPTALAWVSEEQSRFS